MSRRAPSLGRVLLELPLAVVSLAFYLVVRTLARRLPPPAAEPPGPRWQVYCRALFARPAMFYGALVLAPRWNPHALIAWAAPLHVRERLGFDAQAASAAAESWSAVVYQAPGGRTMAWVGTSTGAPGGEHHFSLPPGRYGLSLRYYGLRSGAVLPAVTVDGAASTPSDPIPDDANEGYRDLAERSGLLSWMLHFHLYPLLRLEGWLPAGWIRSLLLPVGNPETVFRHGTIEPGERLVLRAPPALRARWHVHACVYSRDSLPLSWGELEADELALPATNRRGFHVVRLHRRDPAAAAESLADLSIQCRA